MRRSPVAMSRRVSHLERTVPGAGGALLGAARLRDPGSRRIYAGRLRLRANTNHAFQDLANGHAGNDGGWAGAGTWPWLGRRGIALRRRPGMKVYAGAGLEPGTPPACWRVP